MIRIAAVADLHVKSSDADGLASRFVAVNERADLLLLAGDLTDGGQLDEAELLTEALAQVKVPIFAVLGNHDLMTPDSVRFSQCLRSRGVEVLDGQAVLLAIRGRSLGIVGAKGFAGGFGEHALDRTGEPEAAHWVDAAEQEAANIERALCELQTDFRVVMLHYAPVRDTVEGEPLEEVPFYGSSRLCDPINRLGADLVIHGHSHHGTFRGMTPGGIPVYNVAKSVVEGPFALLELGP